MRCKFCKNAFQAKNAASVNVTAAAPPAQANPIPVAKPAHAIQQAPAALAPVAALSGDPFSFPQDDAPVPSVAKPRRKSRGTGLLVLTFLFLFVLGASGAGYFIYQVINTPLGSSNTKVAARPNDRSESKRVVPDPEQRKPMKGNPLPADEDEPKKDPPKKDPLKKDLPKKDLPRKDLPRKDPPKKELPKKKDLTKKKDPVGNNSPPPVVSNDPFPRRALLISVNHYLLFNTVHYGIAPSGLKGGYPGSSTGVLRDRLTKPPMNFPPTQIIELADGVPSNAGKAHPTQKSVLETTIKEFVDTSRPQDRILVFFAGHATHTDEKSYLIPQDGNMKDTETLVPLKWVYDQLASCKAQQKVLILDVFRFSPGRGSELQSTTGEGDEGAMPEGFDKDVLNPPAGVQVWCACQKEQSSIELENGSAFLQALCKELQGGGTELKGIAEPTQPIPVEKLVEGVNGRLKDLLTPEKRSQVSRLTGKAAEGNVPYDAKEPLPAVLTLKPPAVEGGERAGYAQVNKILDELKLLPPVREGRAGEKRLMQAENLPAFSASKLDAYKADGYQSVAELQKRFKDDKAEFAKEFPLRAAIFETVEALQESSKIEMREVLPGPINEKSKASFLLEQEKPGISILMLKRVLAKMKAAEAERDKETSKRWQANFDYTQARLRSRLVYLFEYSYMLGQIRVGNLPDLAPGQNGWRVGAVKKITVTENEAKGYLKDNKDIWKRIQNEYPGTPWSLLAQRESMVALGLQWRPKSD